MEHNKIMLIYYFLLYGVYAYYIYIDLYIQYSIVILRGATLFYFYMYERNPAYFISLSSSNIVFDDGLSSNEPN